MSTEDLTVRTWCLVDIKLELTNVKPADATRSKVTDKKQTNRESAFYIFFQLSGILKGVRASRETEEVDKSAVQKRWWGDLGNKQKFLQGGCGDYLEWDPWGDLSTVAQKGHNSKVRSELTSEPSLFLLGSWGC